MWRSLLRLLRPSDQDDALFDEEIQADLMFEIQQRMEAGESHQKAEQNARRTFGNIGLVKDAMREARGRSRMDCVFMDIRFGIRMLRKHPAFTAVALLTLMIGIGANTAMFSVVDAVLLRPLPYRDPSRLVSLFEDSSHIGFPRNWPAPGNYCDWTAETRIFESVAAVDERSYDLTGSGAPEELTVEAITANLLPTLGVMPILGRSISKDDDKPGAVDTALISYRLWTARFDNDPAVIGRTILLNRAKHTVIGVMPRGFEFPFRNADVWIPIGLTPVQWASRGEHYLNQVIARLRPGVSLEQANAELSLLSRRLAKQYPATNGSINRFFAEPLQDTYTRETRRGLLVLMTAVGFVLLIACANIANLLLARGTNRQREISMRTALGASRARIVRQLVIESTLIAFAGALLGVLLAEASFRFLRKLIPDNLALTVSLHLDVRVLAFSLLVALTSAFVFGLAPALTVSKANSNEVLKKGGRGTTNAGSRIFGNTLVVTEVGLAITLVIGAFLLIQSLWKLRDVNPGFQADHVLTVEVDLPRTKYSDFVPRTEFLQQILTSVRALPGVITAGFTSVVPLTWKGGVSDFTPQGTVLQRGTPYNANDRVVTPGYFEAMRIPLRHGRLFNGGDGQGAPFVAIINETMANRFWPHQDVLGKHFKLYSPEVPSPSVQIVGVVSDTRQMGLNELPRQEMYFPYWQSRNNWMVPQCLVVRTRSNPLAIANPITRAVWSLDREVPVSKVETMEDILNREILHRRVETILLGGLGTLALLLACIGIYGVLAYLVVQRTQEIGIRIAIGARPTDVFRDVIGRGLRLAGFGIVIGLGASAMLSKFLRSILFGISAIDPPTYLSAIVLFVAVAFLACSIPAWRAMRVDPVTALKAE